MSRSEKGWAIIGCAGFYYGSWADTRRGAIAYHVSAYLEDGNLKRAAAVLRGGLDDEMRQTWAECRKRGDRAVKAMLVDISPPQNGKGVAP